MPDYFAFLILKYDKTVAIDKANFFIICEHCQ